MMNKYNQSDVDNVINLIKSKKSSDWMRIREEKSLELFHKAAVGVPAYKDFLKKNNIQHSKIKKWSDFQNIPQINKKNYIRKYPLSDLCWEGQLNKTMVLTATSGSTGEPSYFLRQEELDWQYSIIIEDFLKNNNQTVKGPTLVIICFGMGIWIGGVITYKAYEMAAIRANLPISIITPGINKKEIFSALKRLSPQYRQTIIIGYAPFIKDIIDESGRENVDLKKLNIRFQFAAEAITEDVRDYMYKKVNMNNLYLDFLNIYGSADIGAMAAEASTSILIKRIIKNNKNIFNEFFPNTTNTFTLAQFNPLFINFEDVEGEILITGNNAIPLVRYSIGDNGKVFDFDSITDKLMKAGLNINDEARRSKILENINELPFILIYERRDFSTSFYGINVHPDWVRGALIIKPLADYLTGKFTLITRFDDRQDQYLEINLELRKGKEITNRFKKTALKKIIAYMSAYSSEYRELSDHLKKRAHPILQFWPSEDPLYFRPGVKQTWVQKK